MFVAEFGFENLVLACLSIHKFCTEVKTRNGLFESLLWDSRKL